MTKLKKNYLIKLATFYMIGVYFVFIDNKYNLKEVVGFLLIISIVTIGMFLKYKKDKSDLEKP
ncbi:MAG: hypothetical protein ACYC6P_05105 [Ignavibacteriaceae bacterium]